MPKAMFVISGLGAGGAERVISQIADHWQARGVTVGIASFDSPADPEFHQFGAEIARYRLRRADGGSFSGRLSKLHNLRDLRQLLRRERPDVVIPFLTKNNLLALIATAGLSIPVVCCERNNPERQKKHPAWNAMLGLAYRRARLIICQTEAVKRCFSEDIHDRLRVIPNPVSAWPQRRKDSEHLRMVAVGRLTEQKGFDILLDAFAALGTRAANWRLEIFGEGPLRGALEAQIARLDIADKVQLAGNSAAPGAWVENADLFILSSRYEGFPNVLGEAMAAGLPVIASNCEFGPAEMIEHGRSGLLVPPEDVDALSRTMQVCIEDAELRELLGTTAKSAIGKFAPASVMRRWDAVLAEALSSHIATPKGSVNSLEEPAE
ncbi:glycosyltransferase family 4 protein [Qipengyuania qiaonensis]|uniref:Glycosyltransferase family 4 protein n=1 Tax=Qipengyuania qiaonensis TaxID=2867240 RepID=A0ABS7JEF6_9SPHN|nr:glycosyltransferase family 4 protein [Qipengyuania qiaonensis]MBX7483387.1 glycosyltransferase family 4 protein [Qipengyuania qiaonensis]